MTGEAGKVATSITFLKANGLSGNIFGNRVATTSNIISKGERFGIMPLKQYGDPGQNGCLERTG